MNRIESSRVYISALKKREATCQSKPHHITRSSPQWWTTCTKIKLSLHQKLVQNIKVCSWQSSRIRHEKRRQTKLQLKVVVADVPLEIPVLPIVLQSPVTPSERCSIVRIQLGSTKILIICSGSIDHVPLVNPFPCIHISYQCIILHWKTGSSLQKQWTYRWKQVVHLQHSETVPVVVYSYIYTQCYLQSSCWQRNCRIDCSSVSRLQCLHHLS